MTTAEWLQRVAASAASLQKAFNECREVAKGL